MNYRTHRMLTFLGIAASSLLVCCKMPVASDGLIFHKSHYRLQVVTADGKSHWILTDSADVVPVLTDSVIIFESFGLSLCKVKYDGSGLALLYPGTRWVDRSISPRGDKILLASGFFENAGSLNELYLLDPHGTNLVKLAPPKGVYMYPRISPDLDGIVFIRDGGVARIQADGSGFQYIRAKTDLTNCTHALYVDENHVLFFENSNFDPPTEIWLYDMISGDEKFVESCYGGYPSYGKNVYGSSLLLVDRYTIKICDIFGPGVREVGEGHSACFSSDGSKIVSGDANTIFILNSDGTGKKIIFTETDPGKSILFPQFSPDDKLVVFHETWND